MKSQDALTNKILQIIADKLAVDQNLLSYKTSFSDNLGADSLDVFELIMTVEKEFHLKINEDDIEKLTTTVGALIAYIESKVLPNKQHPHTMVVVAKELQEDSAQNVLLPASQN